MKNVVVVVPTYNARKTIVETIKRIKKSVSDALIIIVDDNSPDGTAKEVRSAFKNDKSVQLLLRNNKQGRGSAVVAGFKEGLKNKKNMYFVEMDADLCHDPKYIPKLVEKCEKADVVIASKYLPSSTNIGSPLKKIIMSRLMNFGARLLLQVPISDYSNGFRCYSRRAVEYITSIKLTSKGFVVLSEIAYRCYKRGFIFAEIPFAFIFTGATKSNLNTQEIKEAIVTLLKLRFS